MEIIIKLSLFILSFSLLIILHELGHFVPAKLFKTKIEKFYLFFDIKFSLFKKKIGETVYGIGWLPLGGYVKIAGMIDESMDTEQMKKEPQPWEFRSKPAWQRLIIMLGGVMVNFILAFAIYIGLSWVYGDKYIDNKSLNNGIWVINNAVKDAGIQNGDKIISIDGNVIERFNDIPAKIITAKTVVVERNNETKTIELPNDFISNIIESKNQSKIISPRIPIIVGEVDPESVNQNLQKGDVFTNINGTEVKFFDEVENILKPLANKEIIATVKRGDKEENITLKISDNGTIGLVPSIPLNEKAEKMGLYELKTENYSLLESISVGLDKGWDKLKEYGNQLKMIVNPDTGAYKGVGGFKAIYDIFPQQWNWEAFWNITAFLSIMLGVVNLLPIPALDGGHVMFLLYEMITGRKPSDKFLEYAQMIGFMILIALLIFANGNDIYKIFAK